MPTKPTDLTKRAITAANRRLATTDPILWSEALAEAPWPAGEPPHLERAFRRAYAERLVERELAKPARVANNQPGTATGTKTTLASRLVRATEAEFEASDRAYRASGARSWNEWARQVIGEAATVGRSKSPK